MGIYLNDGTYEPLLGGEREAFAKLIYEKLGAEAEKEFLQLSDTDDYETGYELGYDAGLAAAGC